MSRLFPKDYLFFSPSRYVAFHEATIWNSKQTRPLCHRHCSASSRNKERLSHIVALLHPSSPSAIFFGIAAVIISSIYFQSFDPSGFHVGDEIRKIAPSRTYINSTTAVIFIAPIFGIVAPLLHRVPNLIERMLFRFICGGMSMSRIVCNEQLDFSASARSRISRTERGSGHFKKNAAITSTIPHRKGCLPIHPRSTKI
jgi:hypothetical protein